MAILPFFDSFSLNSRNDTPRPVMRKFILIILTLCLCSCGRHSASRETLAECEALMEDRPDSALAVLRQIDPAGLSGKGEKAMHALLYSMALDKNYVDSQDDSLVLVAVNYYKHSKDDYHKMLAYYYLARINQNKESYADAITALLEAANVGEKLGDHFHLGMIYRSCSEIYGDVYNNHESLNYAQKSYEQFKEAGKDRYRDWALWDIACAYNNCLDYESAIRTAKEVIAIGKATGDDWLAVDGLRIAGNSYYATSQNQAAIDIYTTLMRDYPGEMKAKDYENLGLAYYELRQLDSARRYMDIVMRIDSTLLRLTYKINKYTGNYHKALTAMEKRFGTQDKIVEAIISQNVTEAVSNYREYDRILREKDTKRKKEMMFATITALLIILALMSIIASMKLKAQQEEIENNMLFVSDLRTMLQAKESEAVGLKNTLDQKTKAHNKENEALRSAVNNLFEQQFVTIEQLASSYYEYQGTKNEQRQIYSNVMKLVTGLGSDEKNLRELENFVDTYKSNLMTRFKEAIPEIKPEDRALFLYSVLGFSSRTMSVFLKEKIEVIYNRKSRLKRKISLAASPYTEEFLGYLK